MIKPWRCLVLGALLLSGCSGVRVTTDFDRDADLASLRSWAWTPVEREETGDLRADSPFLIQRIEKSIERALAGMDLQKTEAESADFLVEYRVVVDSRFDAVEIPATFGFGGYWGGFYGSRVRVDQYETSTLVIDFLDRESQRLLWRGSGEARLRDYGSPEDRAKRVQRTVDAILKHFPPRR